MIDYNWWPADRAPYYEPLHYWVNQVTGHVRQYPCGEPLFRSTTEVRGRPIPRMSHHDYDMWPSPEEKDNW